MSPACDGVDAREMLEGSGDCRVATALFGNRTKNAPAPPPLSRPARGLAALADQPQRLVQYALEDVVLPTPVSNPFSPLAAPAQAPPE